MRSSALSHARHNRFASRGSDILRRILLMPALWPRRLDLSRDLSCLHVDDLLHGSLPRRHARLRKEAAAEDRARECEHRHALTHADSEPDCRHVACPVKSRKYVRMTAIPFRAAAATIPIPINGLASKALSTSSSVAMKPSVPGKQTLARPVNKKQTASMGQCS